MKTLPILLFCGLSSLVIVALPSPDEPKQPLLESKLDELESYFSQRDELDKEVSEVDVAWHLDHTLRTINEIYNAMKNSDPKAYKGSIHLGRSFLLLINKIPGGRAQAPKIVTPPDTILTDSLYLFLKKARYNIGIYDSLPKKAFFKHPYLGQLKKKTARHFLEIHTEHHLKIIRDSIGNKKP